MNQKLKKLVISSPAPDELARRAEVVAAEKGDGLSVHQEFYRRQELAASSEELIAIYMDENGLNRPVAISVLATTLENKDLIFGRASSGGGGFTGGGVREKFWDLTELITRANIELRMYTKLHGNREMCEAVMWLLLGNFTLAGADCQADLIKKYQQSKQAVNKCLKHLLQVLPELGKLEGQRSETARERMAEARRGQL